MEKLRVFTAFSGYDSQCLALSRLRETHGVNYELVGWSEIDKDAIKAHNALFPDAADKNYGDISKIEWSNVPDFDLFTYSSPCQDFSNAGLQRGGEEGSGTRSSLLWECRRAIVAKRPAFLLLENVKALTSEKFLPLLQKWCVELASYGYVNHCAVLNAKDYGVPQNRERVFVFSVRKDIPGASGYRFPRPFPLKRKLRHILEEDVDEKYYLKDEVVERFIAKTQLCKEQGKGFDFSPQTPDEVVGGQGTYSDNYVYGYTRDDKGKVENYHPIETANALTASSGSGGSTDQFVCISMRGRNKDNPNDHRSYEGIEYEQRIEVQPNHDVTNTLTTVQKDNMIMKLGNIVENSRDPERGRVYSTEGVAPTLPAVMGIGGGQQPKVLQTFLNGSTDGEVASTLTTAHDRAKNITEPNGGHKQMGVLEKSTTYRIRKLTERECFRLMGVDDKDIDIIQSSGVSRSAQYKMAGNSIVVDVLYHIFRQAFTDDLDTSGAVVETIKVDVQQLKLF